MTKELSIEKIKKKLIDKISNNSDILEVFRKREYSKYKDKYIKEYGDSYIKDNYIFDHHVSDLADYISVEVDENEYSVYGNSKKEIRKSYKVSILVTLTDTSELDRVSVLLGDISSGSRENVTVTEIISIADMQDKRKAGYTYMFNFRIITTADGNQIIDRNLKTPYEALTPTQMMEYMEMDNSLAFMDRMERKAREKAEHMRRAARNPFYRLVLEYK